MSADEATFRRERAYITKLNAILVAVLKQEWPHRWPTFITDLVAAAKTSETLCENCMVILKARKSLLLRPNARAFLPPPVLNCPCRPSPVFAAAVGGGV